MPFVCKFQLNHGAIEDSDNIIFIEFIDSSFAKFHQAPIAIAKILFNGRPGFINSNSPAFPSAKGALIKNQSLSKETVIGYFSAEGEDIPYNKPYATISLQSPFV